MSPSGSWPVRGSWSRFVTVRQTRMCGWESRPRARRVLPVILGPDLVELICGGVAVLVSTRDSDLQPEIVRAWGPEVSADGSSLTVCVPAAPGSRTAANLESNGEVAALFVSSTDYRAIQVKGRAESLTAPTPEQLQLIEQHVLAFAGRVRELGVNEADIRRVVRPDPVAVRIAVRTGYDQTPGRGAGRPL
jgi:Pyridoxamine 5'-phosphate oxidase